MRKTAFLIAILMGLCLFSACGAETAQDSAAITETTTAAETTSSSDILKDTATQMGTTKKGAGTRKTAIAVQTTTTTAATTTAAETQEAKLVYWTPLGKYWHYSKDCAKSELPDVTYNYKNEPQPLDDATKESMVHEFPESFGMKDRLEPCPDCVGTE